MGTPTIKGLPSDVEWSSAGARKDSAGVAGTYGTAMVLSASRQHTGKKKEYNGTDGYTKIAVYYDEQDKCEIELLMQAAISPPARGTLIKICGVDVVIVDDINHVWANEELRILRVSGTKYPDITS